MTSDEWRALLFRHPGWEVLDENRGAFIIRNTSTGRCYSIVPSEDLTPEEAEDVLEGHREAVVLETLTRIVGYYSRTSNWNASKIAELQDRREGSYSLDEDERSNPDEAA